MQSTLRRSHHNIYLYPGMLLQSSFVVQMERPQRYQRYKGASTYRSFVPSGCSLLSSRDEDIYYKRFEPTHQSWQLQAALISLRKRTNINVSDLVKSCSAEALHITLPPSLPLCKLPLRNIASAKSSLHCLAFQLCFQAGFRKIKSLEHCVDTSVQLSGEDVNSGYLSISPSFYTIFYIVLWLYSRILVIFNGFSRHEYCPNIICPFSKFAINRSHPCTC